MLQEDIFIDIYLVLCSIEYSCNLTMSVLIYVHIHVMYVSADTPGKHIYLEKYSLGPNYTLIINLK